MNPTVVPTHFTAKEQVSSTLSRMRSSVGAFASYAEQKFENAGKAAFKWGRRAAVTGAVIAAPFVVAGKAAVDFEEKMADVAKTTGLEGDALQKYGEDLRKMSTRTRSSIDDLSTISEIGGQLGVPREELLKFTEAANTFSIALGGDFSGGVEEAVSTISKMKSLFKDTRGLDISSAITRSGSAINELGAAGNGTSANIADFGLRMGAMPDILKDTAANTLAMGAYLEEMGIDSQIASGGLSNLLLVAGKNLPRFAKQMGMSSSAAQELLKTNPNAFASDFAQSLKKMSPSQLTKKLNELKIGSQESIKVIGALSSDQVNSATGLTHLAELQNMSNKAFEENNSLKTEAAKKEQTAAAQMAKLKNNLQDLAITVGQELLPVISDLVAEILPHIKAASEWVGRNKSLVKTISKVALSIAGVTFAVSGLAYAIGGVQKAIAVVQIAMKAWSMISAAMAPGFGTVVLAISALVIGAMALKNAFDNVATAENVASSVRERALENTIDQRVEMMQLFNTLRNAKEGTEQYTTALDKLREMSPDIVEKYDLQHKSLLNLARAEKALASEIIKRAEVQARAELLAEAMKEKLRLQEEGMSTFQKVLAFTGNGVQAENLHSLDIANEQQRINILSEQVAQDQAVAANPEAAKKEFFSESIKQQLDIHITGLPDGSTAQMGGAAVPAGKGIMPKLSSTR